MRSAREHNVSGHYRVCGFESPGWPTKITNSLSDEILNRDRMCIPSILKNQA